MKKRRKYITVEVSEDISIADILDQVDDEDLTDECKARGLCDFTKNEKANQLNLAAIELRKMGNINYAVWLEDIAKEI